MPHLATGASSPAAGGSSRSEPQDAKGLNVDPAFVQRAPKCLCWERLNLVWDINLVVKHPVFASTAPQCAVGSTFAKPSAVSERRSGETAPFGSWDGTQIPCVSMGCEKKDVNAQIRFRGQAHGKCCSICMQKCTCSIYARVTATTVYANT